MSWVIGGFSFFLVMLDLFFLLFVAQGMGVWVVIFTQGLGAAVSLWILGQKEINLLFYLQNEWSKGTVIVDELWEEGLFLVGCLFLLSPGFLTDLLGLLVIVPSTRKEIYAALHLVSVRVFR